ncbi:hypothetical protein BC941DRAFT_438777 [Chlamydoabsidia padenii]|nr:hypothetical protein BC941DRAFT_438777 [Chlamydoabsidia padenii]
MFGFIKQLVDYFTPLDEEAEVEQAITKSPLRRTECLLKDQHHDETPTCDTPIKDETPTCDVPIKDETSTPSPSASYDNPKDAQNTSYTAAATIATTTVVSGDKVATPLSRTKSATVNKKKNLRQSKGSWEQGRSDWGSSQRQEQDELKPTSIEKPLSVIWPKSSGRTVGQKRIRQPKDMKQKPRKKQHAFTEPTQELHQVRTTRSRALKLGNHQCLICGETFDKLEERDNHAQDTHPKDSTWLH